MADGFVEETQGMDGPADLEEALRLLREKDAQDAKEDVEPAASDETVEGADEGSGGLGESGADSPYGAEEGLGYSDTDVSDGEDGGPADTAGESEPAGSLDDYEAVQRTLVDSIRRQAAMAANEKFRQEGIEKVTLTQLYQRDENTGRVTFYNPDDPDRPFENRAQAQAWVDSYNSQVEAEWVNYANNMQREFANQTLPAMRLVQFAPTYDAMDPRTRMFFDIIIESYGVRDSTGELIGYSCDLGAAARQARQLASIDAGAGAPAASAQETPAAPASGPALDATTSGSDTSKASDKQPKNLNDAWKMLNNGKKENGK